MVLMKRFRFPSLYSLYVQDNGLRGESVEGPLGYTYQVALRCGAEWSKFVLSLPSLRILGRQIDHSDKPALAVQILESLKNITTLQELHLWGPQHQWSFLLTS
jgi:hypothetical protein